VEEGLAPVLDVLIGYDRQEVVAYHVLCQSILERASRPVRFTPISLASLHGAFRREILPEQSTEFSFSRFLAPYLSGYRGWSLFLDCDMLARADIAELFALADERYAVMVCQHDYVPRDQVKFLNHVQTRYAKKNWSSVMLLNNARCRTLTPAYVEAASGLHLHQFQWLADEGEIGALPLAWNWLVGEYDFNPDAQIAHFTRGGPYFPDYAACDYADEWRAARDRAFAADGRPLAP
jgi:lipopolysaccharide biosynthesis glycosyltransferase